MLNPVDSKEKITYDNKYFEELFSNQLAIESSLQLVRTSMLIAGNHFKIEKTTLDAISSISENSIRVGVTDYIYGQDTALKILPVVAVSLSAKLIDATCLRMVGVKPISKFSKYLTNKIVNLFSEITENDQANSIVSNFNRGGYGKEFGSQFSYYLSMYSAVTVFNNNQEKEIFENNYKGMMLIIGLGLFSGYLRAISHFTTKRLSNHTDLEHVPLALNMDNEIFPIGIPDAQSNQSNANGPTNAVVNASLVFFQPERRRLDI
jgi:hypothetical protein